eukprot:COSAG04_NODE_24_length_37684_cov_50.391060_2_plen_122_part_00
MHATVSEAMADVVQRKALRRTLCQPPSPEPGSATRGTGGWAARSSGVPRYSPMVQSMTGCVWKRSTSGHVRTKSQAPAPRAPSPFFCASISSKTMLRTVAASDAVSRSVMSTQPSVRSRSR